MTALAPLPKVALPPAGPATAAVLDALRRAVGAGGEQRLFRAGKLPGLFAARTGAQGDAARHALLRGWLEVARTEAKGKLVTEWVRVTPAGVRLVHEEDSPAVVLREFQSLLGAAQGEVPRWLAESRRELSAIAGGFESRAGELLARLDGLADRLDAALRRLDLHAPLASGLQLLVPWGADALHYLDRRRAAGAPPACPLGELFASLRGGHPDLTLGDFHDGLGRLRDGRALKFVPSATTNGAADVEYALLHGADMVTHVER